MLTESGLPDRYYLPVEDVAVGLLERSARTTRCPYKGTATYWSARVGLRYPPLARDREEGLVWFWIGHHSEYDRLIKK